MMEYFRNDCRLINAQKDASHSAFAAFFQGKFIDGESSDETNTNATSKTNSKSEDKRPRQCICGAEHSFKKCFYIVKSVWPKDWKPDPAIQKQVEEKIKNRLQRMKSAIK